MEEATDIKTVWFSNMLLLGLDPSALERKLRIPFNKDMFTLPNKKGFEVIMYFLFEKLNPTQAKDEFRYCYPASDKKQETQFRKVCNEWLTRISKEEADANLPRIVASIFLSPGGDKFYELLFAFSTYILIRQIVQYGVKPRNTLKRPYLSTQTLELGGVLQSAVKSGTVRHRNRFLEKAESAVDVQQEWKQYASGEVKRYRALNRSIKDMERKVKSEMEITAEKGAARGSPFTKRTMSGLQEIGCDVQSVKRAQRVQKVRELWKAVDTFYDRRSEEREIVMSVIEGTNEKYRIDSNELDVKIPDLLLRECEKEIHRRSVGNIYQGGKLNLHSLLQLWNLSLHLYIEKFHQVGVNSFEDATPTITTQLHTHQAHLNNARTLRSKLSGEILPVLKQSVQILKKRLDAQILHSRSPGSIRNTVSTPCKSLGLNLLPPTPPVTFTPADLDHTPIPETHHIPSRSDNVSTPEAASHLIDVITNKVKGRQSSSLAHGIPVYTWRQRQNIVQNDNIEVERVGNKQRTRIKSAPSEVRNKSAIGASTALQPIKTDRPKPTNKRLSEAPRDAKNVKVTRSGTQLVETDRKLVESARQNMTEQSVRENDVFKMPHSAFAKSAVSSKSKNVPKVERHHTGSQRVSFMRKPQAHDILADKIVDSILSEENIDQDLSENLTIGQEAFESKDKLSRTPESHPKVPAYPADYSSLLNDSLTHMPSPLSSTRIEAVPIDREEAQDLATRLFAENSDDDDEIVTAGPDISPTPPSTINLSYNNASAKKSLFDLRRIDKENLNPNSSSRRLDGDGGPATPVEGSTMEDLVDDQLITDEELLNLSNMEIAMDRRIQDLSSHLMDKVGHDMLVKADALYEELNQSRTPELPSKRHRSLVSSVSNTPVRNSQPEPPSSSLSPKRSPKMDEIHKSLDEFEELVHSIQEAANNLSQESLLVDQQPLVPLQIPPSTGKVSRNSSYNPLEYESFPGDCDGLDDVANTSARVIELQNGTFTEFLEKPTEKNGLRSQSASFSLTTENNFGDRPSPTLNRTLPVDRETLGNLDKETESIIERYKRLKLASLSAADVSDSREPPVDTGVSDISPKSPCGTSPLNEKYLQETPNKVKVRRSKKVSLLFDQPETSLIGTEFTELCDDDDTTFKKPRTPPRVKKSSSADDEKLIQLSPFSTPTRRSIQESMGSPMFGLHSVPISPTTDTLHRDSLTPRTKKRRSMFESILDEDDSLLLPLSPPTANLLGI